jgi:hypothetical protein
LPVEDFLSQLGQQEGKNVVCDMWTDRRKKWNWHAFCLRTERDPAMKNSVALITDHLVRIS